MQLLAKQVTDPFKRRPLAHIGQPLAQDARFQHGGSPQGESQPAIAFYRLVQVAAVNDPDRAVGQRSYGRLGCGLGPHIAMKITKIAGIVKGVVLALAALERLVETGNSGQQHRQVSPRIAFSDNVFAAWTASPELHIIHEASQLVFIMEAKAIELPTQRMRHTNISQGDRVGRRETVHVAPQVCIPHEQSLTRKIFALKQQNWLGLCRRIIRNRQNFNTWRLGVAEERIARARSSWSAHSTRSLREIRALQRVNTDLGPRADKGRAARSPTSSSSTQRRA